jgi:hypothetical protein
MKIGPHEFIEHSFFEQRFAENDELILSRASLLSEGKGDTQAICRRLVNLNIENACTAILLDKGDEQVLRYFREAINYGVRCLRASGTTAVPHASEVDVEIGARGLESVAAREIPQSRKPSRLGASDFDKILMVVATFGNEAEINEVASCPEEQYQNPDVVTPDFYFSYLRAVKALCLGDRSKAQREARVSLKRCESDIFKSTITTFLSMIEKDADGFRTHLSERLIGHKKLCEKEPHLAEGVICHPGLMLCRMAIERGMSVEEWPYLPVRLIPNAPQK